MTPQERKAMKLALEALETCTYTSSYSKNFSIEKVEDAVIAAEKALAQPEQRSVSEHLEPVAWSYWQSCLNDDGTQTAPWVHRLSKFKPTESIINKDVTPLYTTPQPRKPLTREQIVKCQEEASDEWCGVEELFVLYARAIEAAHGIGDKK